MNDVWIIRQKIDELEQEAAEIEELAIRLLHDVKIFVAPMPPGIDPYDIDPYDREYKWGKLSKNEQHKQRDVLRKYQRWYTVAYQFVRDNVPESADEFNALYYSGGSSAGCGVKDFIMFEKNPWTNNNSEIAEVFWRAFEIQRSILLTVPDMIDIRQMNLRELISTDYIDREIDEADYLYKNGHHHAAGALAGVALEQQLKALCDKYSIEYQKKDTIEPLAQKLYERGCIEVSQLKNIQHLASIRDKCSHASDVTADEVKELIERLKKLIAKLS